MIRKVLPQLAAFATQNKPALVKINVKVKGKLFTYHFAENTKLAPNLQRARVPLEFECGFSCNCGTCPVSLSQADFQSLQKQQPIGQSEQKTLNANNMQTNVRLSCQLTVNKQLQKYKFIIDV